MKKISFALCFLLILGLGGCTVDKSQNDAKINLTFSHSFGDTPIIIFSGRYLNQAANSEISIEKIKYFVDEIVLVEANGVEVPINTTGLIDVSENQSSFSIDAPGGNYKQIKFVIGIDPTSNHGDPASVSPKSVLHQSVHNDMYWSWNPGFIFFKVEGRYNKADGTRSTYFYHIGSDEFARTYTLDKNFVIDGKSLSGNINLDIKKFFGTHNFETGEATNTVGDAIIAPKLAENMKDMVSLVYLR